MKCYDGVATDCRLMAWASRYDLVRSNADECMRVIAGGRCGKYRYPGERDDIHIYSKSGWDDHPRLFYSPALKIYVYTFAPYMQAPKAAITTIDPRGIQCTIHQVSWYNNSTAMHVVTRINVDQTFCYTGEFPRDQDEYWQMSKAVNKYQRRDYWIMPDDVWNKVIALHDSQY